MPRAPAPDHPYGQLCAQDAPLWKCCTYAVVSTYYGKGGHVLGPSPRLIRPACQDAPLWKSL